MAKKEGETLSPKKIFKNYDLGFVHIDIKYLLPQMLGESLRRYLFMAIDRATHCFFLNIHVYMTDGISVDFLRRLKIASPIKITTIVTDNDWRFVIWFSMKYAMPSDQNAFDNVCPGIVIKHRLAPRRYPQTNGMLVRFNGQFSELLNQTRFECRADLEAFLFNYLKL